MDISGISCPPTCKPHQPGKIDARLRAAEVVSAGNLHWFEEIDSTNRWLLQRHDAGEDIHGKVCFAELQTEGCGRSGRSWYAPPSSSVLLSIGWRLGVATTGVSLVSGLAIVDSLRSAGVDSVGLKWPNDLIVRGKKLGGVLTETRGGYAVIGMGINVAIPLAANMQIGQAWTDLKLLGHAIDRDRLVGALIITHCNYLQRFCEGGFSSFAGHWNRSNSYGAAPVTVKLSTETFDGIATGVDDGGALIVVQPTGDKRRVISGEVWYRKREVACDY